MSVDIGREAVAKLFSVQPDTVGCWISGKIPYERVAKILEEARERKLIA
jgi:hypothetical protein